MSAQSSNNRGTAAERVVGIIGWIGTILVFGAVAAKILRPEWNQYATWAAWAGLGAVLVYMAGQWRDVVTFYKGRQARYGTVSLVGIVVFLGILVAANYLSVRRSKRWDFTANQVYSLSDQTIKVLQNLDAPVKFTVFDQEPNLDRFRDRLEQFVYQSPKVTTEYVDADRQPTRARAAKVESYGTILIEYKDRTERVTSSEEQALTNALVKAVTGEQRKVYFTQGHGEKDTAGTDRVGYSAVTQSLGNDNYAVAPLILAQQRTVPADATVVVVAGPRTDFLQAEIDGLKEYVSRGGKVLVMIDPPGDEQAPQPLLTAFLHDWGIDLGTNVVLDASGIGQMLGTDASVPVAANYPSHPMTDRFQLMTAYPLARSVSPVEGGVNGHTARPIVETSPQSWAEADLTSLKGGRVAFDADKGDKQGPVILGAAVSAPATAEATPAPAPAEGAAPPPAADKKGESRVVAFGDSDFAANAFLGIQGNKDFFLNAISWLAQQEGLIAIRPHEAEDRRLTLTADQQQRIMLLSIFIIPGLVFASGFYTWWQRR